MRSDRKNLTVRYSLVQGFLWMGYVPIHGFASVYLLAHGFSNTQIGVISAVASLTAIVLQTVLASSADRSSSPSLKVYLFILAGILVAGAGLLLMLPGVGLPAVGAHWLTGLLFGTTMAILPVLTPFVNALGTESMNQGKRLNYGVARGIGSFAFAVMSSILGVLAARHGVVSIPQVMAVTFLCFLVSVHRFPFQKRTVEQKEEEQGCGQDEIPAGTDVQSGSPLAFFRKYPRFTAVLAGCTLLYACHGFMNNFVFQTVEVKGGGSPEMGIAMTICACAELPVMFLFGWMVKKVRCDIWMRVSGVFYTLKILGTLLVTNVAGFYAVQLFQMFGWAVICVASVYYVNSVMKTQDAIKGQAYMTAAFSVGTVISSLVGGWTIDVGGVRLMLMVALAASAAGMAILFAFCRDGGQSGLQKQS